MKGSIEKAIKKGSVKTMLLIFIVSSTHFLMLLHISERKIILK